MSAEAPASLAGQVAIVTGGGGAIGRAVCLDLAREGAKVVVNDIGSTMDGAGSDGGPADETAGLVREAGGDAIVSIESVADWDGAQRTAALAVEAFGRIDLLVNNAAVLCYAAFQETSPEAFRAHQLVNIEGCFNMARAVAPVFQAQRSGAYVHMTSSTGLIGMRGNAAYVVSKAALVGLSRAIALDMSEFGVRSNCVAPAATSRMSPQRADPETEARYRDRVRADQVAPLVCYLASDAAAEISGQVIGVRGNELYLYSQPRPIRALHRNDGWSLQKIAEQLGPGWRTSLTPLEETYQVFNWPPL